MKDRLRENMRVHPQRSQSTTPNPFDHETLRHVRERRRDALNRFFEHFFDRAYAYVTTLLGDPTQAEDVTQEAFIRIHRGIDRLDDQRDPTPWVFAVVTNTVRDHWRSAAHRQSRRRVELDEARAVAAADEATDPERALLGREDRTAVEEALAALTPADREIILLREYEGLRFAQVAEALDVREDAARQRHARALRRLAFAYTHRGQKDGVQPDDPDRSERGGRRSRSRRGGRRGNRNRNRTSSPEPGGRKEE
jgi:RNA polymerase sigma-70 factor (ECF subfamily)